MKSGQKSGLKAERRSAVLELVRTRDMYNQSELVAALKEAGFDVAQATVSRDIRELGIVKEPTPSGFRFAARIGDGAEPLARAFRAGLVSALHAGNILVLRTLSGMAMAVAAALDKMEYSEILGTVAGDDVVICVVQTPEQAANLAQKLK